MLPNLKQIFINNFFKKLLTSMTEELDKLKPSKSVVREDARTDGVGTATGPNTGLTEEKSWKKDG